MTRQSRQGAKPSQPPENFRRGRVPNQRVDNPNAPKVSQWPPPSKVDRPIVQALSTDLPSQFAAQSMGMSFTAATYDISGYLPPSPMGAVGPSQILLVINGRIRTFNKSTGGLDGALDVTTDAFFASVLNPGGCSPACYTTDPRVVFDRLSQRWFISMINASAAPNRILIAVSSGATITSQSSFTFYYFVQDQVGGGTQDNGLFADFPSLGVDNYALYIGVNMFDTSKTPWEYRSATGFVINKANLLAETLTVTAFRQIGTSVGNIASPVGVTVSDSSVTQGFFVGMDLRNSGTIRLRRISNPGGTPILSSTISIFGPATGPPFTVPAQGSTPLPLDAIDDRLMNAQIINGSLWTTHSIKVNRFGVTGDFVNPEDRNGMRFYEITNLSGTPSLRQSGTLYDTAVTNPQYYWVGSIATSGQGHTALASSYAGPTKYAGVAFDGRYAGDALGTLDPTVNKTNGGGAYNAQTLCSPNCFQRWGDYSTSTLDPSDFMTFWTFQMYTDSPNKWGVLVTQLKAPPPAAVTSASPSSVAAGTTIAVTITGTSSSNSGFYDPGTGFPNRLSATVNGGGVTVNSVTYNSPTSIVLNMTIAGNATPGSRTVTVTNPDNQSATSASGILTITGASITLSPTTVPNGTVSGAYSQTVTASGGTGPYTFSISSGALPAGLLLSSSGAVTGTPTISGTANFTVRALDSVGGVGTRSYTMTVAALVTSNMSMSPPTRSYDSTPGPNIVGKYTLASAILTNNGAPMNGTFMFRITNLSKNGPDQIPSQPNVLLSADNGAGKVGDTQTLVGVTSLGTGQSTPVSFLIGIGSRQSFNFYIDLYMILPGSAATAAEATAFAMTTLADSVIPDGVADVPSPGTPVLVGQYRFLISDPGPSKPPDTDFNVPDSLSNVGVITGSGPQSRPAVAVDPIVPTRIAVAGNDHAAGVVRVSTTQDGGKTWHATTLGLKIGNQTFLAAQNPSLAYDSSGRLSVVYSLSNLSDSANAIVISESSDGITFTPPSAISFHLASDQIIDDRPAIAIKAGVGRYVAWDSFSNVTLRYSINVARSEEGGLFGPATTVVSNGLFSSAALALSKTTVYLGWDDWGFNSVAPYNTGGRLMMAAAPAASNLKFNQPQEISRTSIGFAQKIAAMPDLGVGPNLSLAADPQRDDVVYAVFVDRGNGTDIRLGRSGNRGKKWDVTTVNSDTGGADQFSPAITLDSESNIKISFYDTALSSTFETAHVFLARSTKGDSFETERITTALSNDSVTNPLRDYAANLGDRTAIAMTSGDVLIAWTDTRLGSEDVFSSVVFDPDGEFVTGSGKIMSPPGAYAGNTALTGKAEFGFQAKYRKRSLIPTGDMTFTIDSAKPKVKFKSTSYDWLFVAGAKAQLKGSGTLNGAGDYTFLLTMTDGGKPDGGGVDRFRIKIVDKTTRAVVYDNVPGAPDGLDDANPQAIIEGKIQIHDK
jgi:putative Ig domain-containing protein